MHVKVRYYLDRFIDADVLDIFESKINEHVPIVHG